ncbi:P-loop containing nucleoside triphosphate hydrolase protein [Zopfia rhizophila CBS 207.26]|uniref:P-loop containing nucleoside triphosphate hydrolase protein n=1 Tax=Zopfia rhizophila CBS 207.26 TaxID=1314779 RepID=A0A6A6D5L6_9PEZI|nr:P-loop containing nucleoside triphosphate hydrolase protein [Zopfia rhizophila CBS 207.26]KAF2174698.1 P-loop containing nucleoside triphosphate hydrolase protein [Zopfia rhizophila CBS 207.26]
MSPTLKVMKPNGSTTRPTDTPPSSPDLSLSQDAAVLRLAQQFVDAVGIIAAGKALPEPASPPKTPERPAGDDLKPEEAGGRASKFAYKRVDEVWDKKAYKYKIAEPVAPTGEVTELDQYVFVIRVRIDKSTKEPTSYIDIKSELLRDILSVILQDVRVVSLAEDMPSIDQNVLYHFLPNLESYQSHGDDGKDARKLKHLGLLIDYMNATYKSTTERLLSLLKRGEITYDLLWALFKPNSDVYSICPGTQAGRCLKYIHGEEIVDPTGSAYFRVEGRFFDFDGERIGEAIGRTKIEKFRGTVQINVLATYPLRFHPDPDRTRNDLIQHGRTFLSLRGIHYKEYDGNAFRFDDEGKEHVYRVKSRIMIDAVGFHECNPKYPRRRVNEKKPTALDIFSFGPPLSDEGSQVKYVDIDPEQLGDDELIMFNPTVLGFSLKDKRFLEFAVANICDIQWSSAPFDNVRIPDEKKAIVQALTESYLNRDPDDSFDDFIEGKGRGLVFLLHGPPGVGKTLTAEAIAESHKTPLYAIAAGELGTESATVEVLLSTVFKVASRWNAIVLLDEADVFLAQRTVDNTPNNSLVSVFLRQLEYYQGVLFLTTNRVQTFDEAVASRIHYGIKYGLLGVNARREIWQRFLAKASTKKGSAKYDSNDLEDLAKHELNGREIKNAVSMARALASHQNTYVTLKPLTVAIDAINEFQNDFTARSRMYA